jgi:uncharacterized protein (TIGR02466 family)
MIIETWFPTPVLYNYATDEIKELIKNKYFLAEPNIINKIKTNAWGDNVNSTFYNTENLIDECDFFELKSFILDSANEFLKQLYKNSKPLKLVQSWVNYCHTNQYQNIHHHLPNCLSGVYYIKTNGKDGNLRIYPPSIVMGLDATQATNLTHNSIEYGPEEGKLIMFPSWMQHSVVANFTNAVRISISFNLN